jgi:hypothetical protein
VRSTWFDGAITKKVTVVEICCGGGRYAVPSRTEPYRAVPSRTEPYRAVPSRTEPYRAVPSRTEPYRAVRRTAQSEGVARSVPPAKATSASVAKGAQSRRANAVRRRTARQPLAESRGSVV